MDMHNGAQFREIADHHDDIVSFERAAAGRKIQNETATPVVASTAGEGWYHEAAIASGDKDAIEARSNPYHH